MEFFNITNLGTKELYQGMIQLDGTDCILSAMVSNKKEVSIVSASILAGGEYIPCEEAQIEKVERLLLTDFIK